MWKIYAFCFCALVSCADSATTSIAPLHPYLKDNEKDTFSSRRAYFLVENLKSTDTLFKFGSAYRSRDTSRFDFYSIIFYKASSKTNKTYRETPSDLIEWHSKDLIFVMDWEHDKIVSTSKYKNGKLILDDDVKIIEITPNE